jgi:hypothetical protein
MASEIMMLTCHGIDLFRSLPFHKKNASTAAAGTNAKKYWRHVIEIPIDNPPIINKITENGPFFVWRDADSVHARTPARANNSAGPSVSAVALAIAE